MAGLEINLTPINGSKTAMIAEMSGAIDGNTVPSFVKKLEDLLKQGVESLILDMSNIRYVNSTGLGSLVKYADEFKKKNGGMALIKVPPKVKIVIEMLGLNAFFEICSDADSALQALGGGSMPANAPVQEDNSGFELGPARDIGGGLGGASNDPFGGSNDPFGGGQSKDPFGGGQSNDPFGGGQSNDPFGSGQTSNANDPFGGASDPFGGSSNPIAPPKKPVTLAQQNQGGFSAGQSQSSSSGGQGFPLVTDCQSCGVKLRFSKAGAYKCSRCHVRVRVTDGSKPNFTKPDGRGVAVSLPARQECGLGLLHLATSVCEKAMNKTALDAVRHAIHEVTQVLQQSIYANNPEGMYHVAIDIQSHKVDIRFSDCGTPIDISRLKLYFPNSTRYMDSFDCKPHPSGGNIIRMSKGY